MFHSKCVTFKGMFIGDIVRFISAEGDCSALLLYCGEIMIVVEWKGLGYVWMWCPWIMGDGVDRSEGNGAGSAQRSDLNRGGGVVIGGGVGVGDCLWW